MSASSDKSEYAAKAAGTVIEDYIHGEATKLAALVANNFFALIIGVACALAVLKLVVSQ